MSQQTQELLSLLQQRLVPAVLQMGFERVPLAHDDQKSPQIARVFPLGYLKRRRGAFLDVIEVQLDKYDRTKFVLNAGRVPPEGVSLPWAKLTQDQAGASDLNEAYHLFSDRNHRRWFAPIGLWPVATSSRLTRSIDHAVALLPEVEDWFRNGRVGPHMQLMPRAQLASS